MQDSHKFTFRIHVCVCVGRRLTRSFSGKTQTLNSRNHWSADWSRPRAGPCIPHKLFASSLLPVQHTQRAIEGVMANWAGQRSHCRERGSADSTDVPQRDVNGMTVDVPRRDFPVLWVVFSGPLLCICRMCMSLQDISSASCFMTHYSASVTKNNLKRALCLVSKEPAVYHSLVMNHLVFNYKMGHFSLVMYPTLIVGHAHYEVRCMGSNHDLRRKPLMSIIAYFCLHDKTLNKRKKKQLNIDMKES